MKTNYQHSDSMFHGARAKMPIRGIGTGKLYSPLSVSCLADQARRSGVMLSCFEDADRLVAALSEGLP